MRMRKPGTMAPEPDPLSVLACDDSGWNLSARTRAHIIGEALAARRPAVGTGSVSRQMALASGGALLLALLLVGTGYLRSTGAGWLTPIRSSGLDATAEIRVYQRGDEVVLEWNNGNRETYTVRQASSAARVHQAPGVEVQGHRYVDRSPSDAQIVYYLVE